jgi:hypothetical protein
MNPPSDSASSPILPTVPDKPEPSVLKRLVPDCPVINQGLDALGNWEPYASVLGDRGFLIVANGFARQSRDKQRYVVRYQPAGGAPSRLTEGFFGDDGRPHDGEINASRQNGNPGRVAGDPRPGASHYLVGGEASPHHYPAFQSDGRWLAGFGRTNADGVISRYATVQAFRWEADQPGPVPLRPAWDPIHGSRGAGRVTTDQDSRLGGDLVGLSNGTFVVVVEDRSRLLGVEGSAAVARLLNAQGQPLGRPWVVAPGPIWSNVAAFAGGFAVRVGGILHCFDNSGTRLGAWDQEISGLEWDRERGDGTRIAGHVASPYLYLAGKTRPDGCVWLAVFHPRRREFLSALKLSQERHPATHERVTLAVDALDRITVAWVSRPEGYEAPQVAVQVMAWEAHPGKVRPLTPAFWAFLNHHPTGIRSSHMSVAMNTREILVAARGNIHLSHQPEQGPDSPADLNFYTVLSHPDPQPDPTPRAA